MRFLFSCLLLIIILSAVPVMAQGNAEATETPVPPVTITIWWPDSFARVNNSDINPILLEQTEAFAEQYTNIIFDHRLKAVGQPGGIISTLLSASNAARGALPALTLVRRQDLIFTRASGYLQSMEGFPSSIQGDLNNAMQLGLVDNTLYGVPYLLELRHMVYRPVEGVDYSDWSFDAVLERGESFMFAGNRVNSLNETLALQYIAGGGFPPGNSELILNELALSSIFEFYQSAGDNGILDNGILDYNNTTNYLEDFVAGDINTGVFNSTQYLNMIENEANLAIAPIPTESGMAETFLNGWLWVMITQDAEKQEIALDYLNWMFDAGRQSQVAHDVGMIPSRETAMLEGLAGDVTPEFYINMIENAILPLSESEIGAIGREIQNQFTLILGGEQSVEDAIDTLRGIAGE